MYKRLLLAGAVFLGLFCSMALASTNFYRENRNGKVFILQVDPDTNIETVFNSDKQKIFIAPNAKRLAVTPIAGWGDYTSNKGPNNISLLPGEVPGSVDGIITLRLGRDANNHVIYRIYAGPNKKLFTLIDTATNIPANYDIACSQFLGKKKNILRVYLFLSSFKGWGPTLYRLEFDNFVLKNIRYKNAGMDHKSNWSTTLTKESGAMSSASAIEANAAGNDNSDLVVYEPTRKYSLQHMWDASSNNGVWGINYLMKDSIVYKANSSTPLTTSNSNMSKIFDVSVDLGNAFADTIKYIRSYYNTGVTFVIQNKTTNATYKNMYSDLRDPAGQLVEIRENSQSGAVLEKAKVNPNCAVIGHNASALYGLSCKNALSGTSLIVYEPVYKLNPAAIAENEFTDNNRNNVPDNFDNDGKGYWGYRSNFFIDTTAGSSISSDYVLDFVIAHKFNLSNITASNELTYRELALERKPDKDPTKPSHFILGETVHIRIGNIAHRNPDTYGEYNQFGWNGNPGNALFLYVSNNGDPYNTQNTAAIRNSGKILGVEVKNTSNAAADYFGVVGNDDWASGQGDLYFLSRKYGQYINPKIIDSNTTKVPPCTGYGLWWKYQYQRKTYYGVSRTYWVDSEPNTEWINDGTFFIGNSVYSQKVYTVNCGCRGLRYDNFKLEKAASSPLLDFAIINIGAPPFHDGTIAPTIIANNGVSVVKPNTPVKFTGHYDDPANLIDPTTVQFRYVILNNAFNDNDPSKDSNLVIDSLTQTGGYLSVPNWQYVFKDSDLGGKDVATFVVYLGIKFKCNDYDIMPYPAYSWWPLPIVDKFAWSNSDNASLYDGKIHDHFGAPLRITVNTKNAPTPQNPLTISSVAAATSKTGLDSFSSGVVKGNQNESVKIRIDGYLRMLSEIPDPKDQNYGNAGGIMPWPYGGPNTSNHYRVSIDDSKERFNNTTLVNLTSSEIHQDYQGIRYAIYFKAQICKEANNIVNYTQTIPSTPSEHLLYDGVSNTSIDGWQEVASGTLDAGFKQNFNSIFTGSIPTVNITPIVQNDKTRVASFTLITPEFKIPVPLDTGNDSDEISGYRVKVAFKFPVGAWSQVEVNNYDSAQIVKSYNCNKTSDIIVTSDSISSAKNVRINILDTEGPTIDSCDFPSEGFSGDAMPASPVALQMTDNNPHDYLKRATLPTLKLAYDVGKDQYLKIQNESGDLPADAGLGFNLSQYDKPNNFDSTISIKNSGGTNWACIQGNTLSSYTVTVTPFPGLCKVVYKTNASTHFIPANSIYESAFNADQFKSKWYLYAGAEPPVSDQPADCEIVDGSDNLFDSSTSIYKGLTKVYDNDCPNVRVIISNSNDSSMMIEVRNGIKDSSTAMNSRKIKIINLKNNTKLYEANYKLDKLPSSVKSAPLVETYSLNKLATPQPGYTITTPFTVTLPVMVTADSRLKLSGEAFDNGSAAAQGVNFTINDPKVDLNGSNNLTYIFRRGLINNNYVITATTSDTAGNKVVINIPIKVVNAKKINIRTMEEKISR